MTSWLTVILAGVAVLIAFMQWFVARQKFVLDLFDRRFKAYNDVISAMRPFHANGAANDHNEIVNLQISIQNSKYLFGSDVSDYLDQSFRNISRLRYWSLIYNTNNVDASNAPEGILQCSLRIEEFFIGYPKLCEAYMMMPEKRVRTPIEWFNDRNNLRKSYGGEPGALE